MPVHPAAGGFASAAPTDARLRPTYARAVVGAIKERTVRGGLVLDLGAGTGILSGQLRRAGMWVVAVETSTQMLEQLMLALPEVPAVRAGERLPVRSHAVDTVTVGDPSHWIDAPMLLGEARRALRSGGFLAVARNVADDSVDWFARYGEALTSEVPERQLDTDTHTHTELDATVAAVDGFGPAELLRAPNPRPGGPQMLVDRAASTGVVENAEPAARERVLGRVRELVTTHPDLAGRPTFELPYVTELWTWRAI